MAPNLEATCQCGRTVIPLPSPAPLRTYLCHCTQCQRQSSSAFGISCIFPAPSSPPVDLSTIPTLKRFTRPTLSGKTMHCYFCSECGSRLVHVREGVPRWSVKGGCMKGGVRREWLKEAEQIWVTEAVVPRAWLESGCGEGVRGRCWEEEPDGY